MRADSSNSLAEHNFIQLLRIQPTVMFIQNATKVRPNTMYKKTQRTSSGPKGHNAIIHKVHQGVTNDNHKDMCNTNMFYT